MDPSKDTITVEIGGRNYTLKTGGKPEYVNRVASYVDQKIQEIGNMAPSLPPTHLAVLAAMNIADELFQQTGGDPEVLDHLQVRIQSLIDRIPE